MPRSLYVPVLDVSNHSSIFCTVVRYTDRFHLRESLCWIIWGFNFDVVQEKSIDVSEEYIPKILIENQREVLKVEFWEGRSIFCSPLAINPQRRAQTRFSKMSVDLYNPEHTFRSHRYEYCASVLTCSRCNWSVHVGPVPCVRQSFTNSITTVRREI
jgi:hypothetical protein